MSKLVNDQFTKMRSAVRFEPNISIRFLSEEIRRYGIKTNSKTDKDKTIFFQSAHIVMSYDQKSEEGTFFPSYALVSFKDLFQLIGKNENGVDDQDLVRVWYIAEKLEKRRLLTIKGTASGILADDERPVLPDVYANLHHIHRNDPDIEKYVYKSKFATNKAYPLPTGGNLICIADYFLIG